MISKEGIQILLNLADQYGFTKMNGLPLNTKWHVWELERRKQVGHFLQSRYEAELHYASHTTPNKSLMDKI